MAKAQQGKKVNIVDNMMKMLEEYSNNLEGIVRARTAELEVEKQKSQELLRSVWNEAFWPLIMPTSISVVDVGVYVGDQFLT